MGQAKRFMKMDLKAPQSIIDAFIVQFIIETDALNLSKLANLETKSTPITFGGIISVQRQGANLAIKAITDDSPGVESRIIANFFGETKTEPSSHNVKHEATRKNSV
jgi:hypothetical protein